MNTENEVALITGASRGLGRDLARQLGRRGVRVVAVARDAIAVEAVAGEIRAAGGWAVALAADVADVRAIYPLVARAAESAGPLTLLVNNASTLGAVPLRPLLETECEDLVRVLETNLIGPFRLMKAVLGSMLVRERGMVVNISSDAAREAYPNWGAYSASKAALHHLTRVWEAELGAGAVRFLSFDPGEMDTEMHADALPESDRASLQNPADVAARLLSLLDLEAK